MKFPENLKYTNEHEWLLDNGDGTITIGITDFAQSELGDIVYIEIDTIGETIKKDAVFGTVEAVKTTSELFMPVSGEILEFNPKLDENDGDNPSLVNEDAYGDGWIVKVRMSDPSELDGLMTADEYAEMIG